MASSVRYLTKTIERRMCTLALPTRKGICDEGAVKEWVQQPVQRVMEQPVTDAGLVDIPRLGIVDGKSIVATVAVGTVQQVTAQAQNIIHEADAELLYVGLFPLAHSELIPRRQQILYTGDTLQRMLELNSTSPFTAPPPEPSCRLYWL